MRTRGAAKKAAEVAALSIAETYAAGKEMAGATNMASDAVTSLEESMSLSQQEISAINDNAIVGSKRKRQTQKPGTRKRAQPAKKTWMLPHGIGAVLENSNDSTAESTSSLSQPSRDSAASVTAPGVRDPALPESKQTNRTTNQEAVITEPELLAVDNEGVAAKTEEPPAKVRRVTRSRKIVISKTVEEEHDDEKTLILIKTEETTTVKEKATISSTNVRKLFIFKNIKLNGNTTAKLSETTKITVDASQILDPNKRITVKRGPSNPYGLTPGYSPYPYRSVPTPEECEEVHRILTGAHKETASKLRAARPEVVPVASLEVAGCGEVPCVLDGLLRTVISANTLMPLANAAVKALGTYYGVRKTGTGAGSIDWDKVRLSSHEQLAEVIKRAGNGVIRAKHIKAILDMVYKENIERGNTANPLSLDHMRTMTKDEAMAKFVSYPGIGIKTAACVSLFSLQLPCFAVDTHVHKFCGWLGWTPAKADPDNCYRHMDARMPDHLKYGLHNLFIVHGQECFKCRKITKPGTKDWNEAPECPLEHLLDRSKGEATSEEKGKTEKRPKMRGREKEVKNEEDGSDMEVDQKEKETPKNSMSRKNKSTAKKEAQEDMDMEETEDLNMQMEEVISQNRIEGHEIDKEECQEGEGDSDNEADMDDDDDDDDEDGDEDDYHD